MAVNGGKLIGTVHEMIEEYLNSMDKRKCDFIREVAKMDNSGGQ